MSDDHMSMGSMTACHITICLYEHLTKCTCEHWNINTDQRSAEETKAHRFGFLCCNKMAVAQRRKHRNQLFLAGLADLDAVRIKTWFKALCFFFEKFTFDLGFAALFSLAKKTCSAYDFGVDFSDSSGKPSLVPKLSSK